MQQGYKDESPNSSLSFGDKEGEKPQSSSIVNVWDFIGENSDCESVGASSTRSPLDGDGNSIGLPSDCDFSEQVASELFEEPCEPVSTSGGTAAFFHVRYRSGQEPPGHALNYFVGKDLSHASDEIEFYDCLRVAVDKDGRYSNFAEMCMDCPGVSKLICKNPKDNTMQVRFLLLLENLWNGYDKMRLVDVKMGAETSVACWKGKSRLHAWKNARVDQRTNSLVEGFRLEGMECPPRAIRDRIEAVEIGTGNRMRSKIISGKAAKRFLLQRLRAHEFMASWCDVSSLGAGAEAHAHSAVWSAIEQVGKLLRLCVELPVPQQWIGSSIAMSLEVGKICKNPNVRVKVFDWGRAELSSIEHHQSLNPEQRKDRLRFWRQYIRAVCRFYWELCRIAAHRCCCTSWTAFVFELRIEPVSIVRAALTGKTVSEVRGIGLFQMPTTGIKGGSASIVLPLVAPKGVATPSNNKSMIGALHIHISAPEDTRCGEGSVIIEVRGATQLPNDLDHAGAAITVVRVIGFERVGDARLHCDKYRGGHPEPTPRGRAYALITAPGKIVAGTMVWENSFEFIGLGDEARRAQARLEEALPEIFSDGPSSSPSATDKEGSPWPEMMPPTVGDQSQVESVSQVFSQQLVSWLDESAPLPPGWP
mmetsp:Transcript_99434/g.157322  ORF Transcript_99434/g.157322 Transcript_99434/m.157322 type:complete len:647 (+) Transcript_99434:159-2099(+)